jgi:hypothetical protein
VGSNSIVGTATYYRMESMVFKSWWGQHFPHPSRPAPEFPPASYTNGTSSFHDSKVVMQNVRYEAPKTQNGFCQYRSRHKHYYTPVQQILSFSSNYMPGISINDTWKRGEENFYDGSVAKLNTERSTILKKSLDTTPIQWTQFGI